MTAKHLWLITALIYLLYAGVFALFYTQGIHNESRHFGSWLELVLMPIVSLLGGLGAAVVAAIIPWNSKGFLYRFKIALPILTACFIILNALMWAGGLYVNSKGMGPVHAKDVIRRNN